MSEVVTYANDPSRCFCGIRLDTGENILISIAGSPTPSVRVSQLDLLAIPTRTIWEYNPTMAGGYEAYVRKMMVMFQDPSAEPRHPLDILRDRLLACHSIEEVRGSLFEAERRLLAGQPTGLETRQTDSAQSVLLKRAEEIVNAYGRAWERSASLPCRPVSTLPHGKDQIKAAIKTSLRAVDQADPKTRELMRVAYANLATFVPDEDAVIAARAQAATLSGDRHHKDWFLVGAAAEIQRRISDEEALLLAELDAFLAGLETRQGDAASSSAARTGTPPRAEPQPDPRVPIAGRPYAKFAAPAADSGAKSGSGQVSSACPACGAWNRFSTEQDHVMVVMCCSCNATFRIGESPAFRIGDPPLLPNPPPLPAEAPKRRYLGRCDNCETAGILRFHDARDRSFCSSICRDWCSSPRGFCPDCIGETTAESTGPVYSTKYGGLFTVGHALKGAIRRCNVCGSAITRHTTVGYITGGHHAWYRVLWATPKSFLSRKLRPEVVKSLRLK